MNDVESMSWRVHIEDRLAHYARAGLPGNQRNGKSPGCGIEARLVESELRNGEGRSIEARAFTGRWRRRLLVRAGLSVSVATVATVL